MAGICERKLKLFKKTQKRPFWALYIFSKTVHANETIFYNRSTSYYGTMCAIGSKEYSWDLKRTPNLVQKTQKKSFLDFLYFLKKCAGD